MGAFWAADWFLFNGVYSGLIWDQVKDDAQGFTGAAQGLANSFTFGR